MFVGQMRVHDIWGLVQRKLDSEYLKVNRKVVLHAMVD